MTRQETHDAYETHPTLSSEEARSGEKTGHVRVILAISTSVTAIALAVILALTS